VQGSVLSGQFAKLDSQFVRREDDQFGAEAQQLAGGVVQPFDGKFDRAPPVRLGRCCFGNGSTA
jgi:hypothetical protein